MKRIYTLLALPALAAVVSCTELVIHDNEEGVNPDTKGPYTALLAEKTAGRVIDMTLTRGGQAATAVADFYLRSSLPFEKSGTVWLGFADSDFVKEYSEATGTAYTLLPAAYYRFGGGNSIEISAGSMESDRNRLTVSTKDMFGNVIAPGRYLLPVVGDGTGVCGIDDGTVLIDLTVREPYTDPDGIGLYTGEDLVTIFYLNTAMFDPRLSTDMIITTDLYNYNDAPKFGIGNIVNLRLASVAYDEPTGKVSVAPGNDLRYVLEHYTERVLPVQESGRKVCICIEGGGKGVGFCNFTDEQIADFTASAKRLVDSYNLDGINLWDRNSGYGREGTPQMNTTSYPKLVKALRQALGPQKLLTVVDYREQTEYFGDVTKTGGIAVGEYIDYAWHGYNDTTEPLQIVDPWAEDKPYHSKTYSGTRIAGLDHTRYGCIHWAPRRSEANMYDNVKQWIDDNRQNNMVLVFYDIESILQHGGTDGASFYPGTLFHFAYDVNYDQDLNRLDNKEGTGTSQQYGKWLKDW